MKNINISLIDQIIYSASPFLLFLMLSANTEITTFALLSSTYTINVLFNSSYQAYLIEPVITHWNNLDEKMQNQLLVRNLINSISESYVVQIFSFAYSALILSTLLNSVFEIVAYLLLLWLSGKCNFNTFTFQKNYNLTNHKQKSVSLFIIFNYFTSLLISSLIISTLFQDSFIFLFLLQHLQVHLQFQKSNLISLLNLFHQNSED